MPEQLFNSMQITANKIGDLLGLEEEFTRLTIKETSNGKHLVLSSTIKNIVEKYDIQKVVFFQQEGGIHENLWTLSEDCLQTENYHLIGVLASAYCAIVQPLFDKIQSCLQETLVRIKNVTGLAITTIPSYLSEEKMFCVNIIVNDSSPIQICHDDPDVLIQVVSAGLPQVIKKLAHRGKK